MPPLTEQNRSKATPSSVISFLRFPLSILIVLFHAFGLAVTLPAGVFNDHQPLTDFIYWHILHGAIATSAVPLFFAFSGYLYFRSRDFSLPIWREKTRKRFLRLVVPLLSWAFAAFILFLVFYLAKFPNATANAIFGSPHPFIWWVDSFTGIQNPMGPRLAPVAWFVRDLFVVGLLSPILWIFLRRRISAILLLIALFVLYLVWFAPLPFLGSRALFFFSLGAAYSIHQRDFLRDARRWALPFLLLWILDVALLFHFADNRFAPILGHLLPCFFIPTLLTAAAYFSERFQFHPLLSSASFFIYFCHESLWIHSCPITC